MRSLVRTIIPRPIRNAIRRTWRGGARYASCTYRWLRRPWLYWTGTAERVGIVYSAPSDMRLDDRLCLYALVRGIRPRRVLEIGALCGGSGCIMANAMEENGMGQVVGLDPRPQFTLTRRFHGRYTIVRDYSPQGIPAARQQAGHDFDMVLIDGLHTYDAVRSDIEGVLPHLTPGGYLLFHDAYHYGVSEAIDDLLRRNSHMTDCGFLCRSAQLDVNPWTAYGGLRMVRRSPEQFGGRPEIEAAYAAGGKKAPPFGNDILNHDGWYCRTVQPCPRCRSHDEAKTERTNTTSSL